MSLLLSALHLSASCTDPSPGSAAEHSTHGLLCTASRSPTASEPMRWKQRQPGSCRTHLGSQGTVLSLTTTLQLLQCLHGNFHLSEILICSYTLIVLCLPRKAPTELRALQYLLRWSGLLQLGGALGDRKAPCTPHLTSNPPKGHSSDFCITPRFANSICYSITWR